MKTFLFVAAGFLMMLFMGTVYAWSVFRVEVETVYGANTLQSGLPYMTSLFFYAVSMMLTGRFLTLKNTKIFALFGAGMIAAGWLLSSQAGSLTTLTLSYGLFIGVGVGMVYGVPVCIMNQSSARSGLYTGIILSGFGASPLVSAPLVHNLIETVGLSDAFFAMGVLSAIVLTPLSLVMKGEKRLDCAHNSPEAPFSKSAFALLYGMFLLATTIGLMMIGLTHRIGVLNYGFNVRRVVVLLSVFAVLNGLARPMFGHLVDKKGFLLASFLSVGLLLLASLLAMVNQGDALWLFAASMGLFWFNLGAWLSMMPACVKEYFGTSRYAELYGLLFTAYGFGAIFGTILSGIILDVFLATTYLYAAIFLVVVLVVALGVVLKNLRLNASS